MNHSWQAEEEALFPFRYEDGKAISGSASRQGCAVDVKPRFHGQWCIVGGGSACIFIGCTGNMVICVLVDWLMKIEWGIQELDSTPQGRQLGHFLFVHAKCLIVVLQMDKKLPSIPFQRDGFSLMFNRPFTHFTNWRA